MDDLEIKPTHKNVFSCLGHDLQFLEWIHGPPGHVLDETSSSTPAITYRSACPRHPRSSRIWCEAVRFA